MVMVMDTPAGPIDSTSDRPIYKQIADLLRREIDDGAYSPEGRLPSEKDLMLRTHASRATVRRGLAELINEGRAEARPGRGVFVIDDPPRLIIRDPVRTLTMFREVPETPSIETAAAQGFDYFVELLALQDATASTRVARLLGIDEGADVFVRRRRAWLRRAGSTGPYAPVKLADSYILPELATGAIREGHTGPGGLYARIEEQGHRITHFEESLEFRMPTPREQRLLKLATGVPVVDHTRQAYANGRAVECFVAVVAGDRFAFEYRIAAQ